MKVTAPWRGGGSALLLGSAGPACAEPPLLPGQPVSGTRRRCQGKLAAPLPSNKPGPTRREDPPGPARRCPPRAQCQAGRAGPAPGDGERAHWSLPRPPACPDLGEPSARGAGSRAPGSCRAQGLQACGLRPARVRSGRATVLLPPPRPAPSDEDGHLGWAGNRGSLPRKVRWCWPWENRDPAFPSLGTWAS